MFPLTINILIVDDMRAMRLIVRKALTGMGFTRITECEDGSKAWQTIEENLALNNPQANFDLIVSDWNMPKLTGIDLLRKVRANAITKKTPFILLTAEGEKSQVLEAVQAGVSSYIMKPFTGEILKQKIEAVHKNILAAAAPKAG